MVALDHFLEHRAADRPRASCSMCQAEPTLHQGADGDVAVSARGTCWVKEAGAWRYEDELGDVCERERQNRIAHSPGQPVAADR